MSEPVVRMFYFHNDIATGYQISPMPNFSYNLEPIYNNDVIISYSYNITLNGICIRAPNERPDVDDHSQVINEIVYLKNVFSSNGGFLRVVIDYGGGDLYPVLYATDIKVKKISFTESDNSWSKFANYSIELTSNHLFMGNDLTNVESDIILGVENLDVANNLKSPFAVNIANYKIKSFNENFDMNIADNIFSRTSIFNNYKNVTTSLGGEYFTISYTATATGKQDTQTLGGVKRTLPAWEHAKRFVHAKLLQQMSNLFTGFLSMNGEVSREFLHNNAGIGIFSDISQTPSVLGVGPQFFLYNEHFDFSVSESEGSFNVTYNATIKKRCSQFGFNNTFCKNNVIHTINKDINQTYNANESINAYNKEIEININGTIKGLVPGGIFSRSESKLKINDLFNNPAGSFLVYNNYNQFPFLPFGDDNGLYEPGGSDRNFAAETAFNAIFDYQKYDFIPEFKELIGITYEALVVSPTATLKPSKMAISRNHLEGTINYNATYDNKFNCDPNNFEVQLSIEEPNPVIAEFTIPNNNIKGMIDANEDGVLEEAVCAHGRGYSVIQLLGTFTPKKIDVTINGNLSLDFNKCCLGSTDNWNLLDYDFMKLGSFAIPTGVNIPRISDSYVLTKKTKTVTYPKGELSINLSYICADVCEIDKYFTGKNIQTVPLSGDTSPSLLNNTTFYDTDSSTVIQ